MPPSQTGYLGNLTPDQEAKLKDLWLALAKVTGISLDRLSGIRGGSIDLANGTGEALGGPDGTPEGKKKRRFGLGSKKSAPEPVAVEEDKYGQNKEFAEVIKEMSPEQLRTSFWSFSKADNPDALLLRFLRARKWNVQNALVMMVSTVRWRGKVVHVDNELVKTGEGGAQDAIEGTTTVISKELGQEFLNQLRIGKAFVHGLDNAGRPMCFIKVRLHRGADQSQECIERFTVFVIETARIMLVPPIETAAIVFDLSSFSMANMDYTALKFMIKCFEANYPESLGLVFIYKAPWIVNGIWNVVKGWLDPVVAAKVHFIKDAKALSEHVALNRIPKEMGGDEDWEYEYVEPVSGENDTMKDIATKERLWEERLKIVHEYEEATIDWIVGSDGSGVAAKRMDLAEQLRLNYWKMDPYIRAKTLYDRLGIIKEGGVIDMYPVDAMQSRDLQKLAGLRLKEDTPTMTESDDEEYFDAFEWH